MHCTIIYVHIYTGSFEYTHLELFPNSKSGYNHPLPHIQNTLVSVMGKEKEMPFAMVATANIAHLEFVLNMQESIKKFGQNKIGGIVIVCFDEELKAQMEMRGIPSLRVSDFFNYTFQDQNNLDDNKLKSEHRYGSAAYNRLVNMKIDIAYIILRYYDIKNLVYTDIDMVFLFPKLYDYFSFFLKERQFDILFTSSGASSFYPCTGFYVAKKSNFTIDFLGSIMNSSRKFYEHDQQMALIVYNELPAELKLKVHVLDPLLFMDGGLTLFAPPFGVKPWLFHANYVTGKENKKLIMQDNKFWFLPEEGPGINKTFILPRK